MLRMSLSNVYGTQVFAKKHSKETLVHGQNLSTNLDSRCEVRGVCVCVLRLAASASSSIHVVKKYECHWPVKTFHVLKEFLLDQV